MRYMMASLLAVMTSVAFSYPSKASKEDKFLASGQLTLDNALVKSAQGIKTLFIVIYDADSSAPMPYAAQKVGLAKDAKGKFHSFKLSTNSIQMMGGRMQSFPKNLKIKARLDKDGSAGPDGAGDIIGIVNKVAVGSKNVSITLNNKK